MQASKIKDDPAGILVVVMPKVFKNYGCLVVLNSTQIHQVIGVAFYLFITQGNSTGPPCQSRGLLRGQVKDESYPLFGLAWQYNGG